MRNHPNAVAIHPYFKVHPGNEEAARALMPRFVEQTRSEPGCLFYGFTTCDDEVFCQEAYVDGDAVLAHLQNVGALLGEMLKLADLLRLEFHGPAAELAKIEPAAKGLGARYFAYAVGLD
ncbi:MAG TPA: antibiotic biosynthesis monooxygenase [Nannocystaceae bacterium]|nr:antibiotic biosynthesis monooxygenase [Nannocystaceae bacterium]